MSVYRKLEVRFWRDEKVIHLSHLAKYAATYLMSAQANRIGIFPFSVGLAAEDMGIEIREAREAVHEVCEALGWQWDETARVFLIPTWFKVNGFRAAGNVQGAAKDIADTPDSYLWEAWECGLEHLPEWQADILRDEAERLGKTTSGARPSPKPQPKPQPKPRAKPIAKPPPKPRAKVAPQEQEQEQEQKKRKTEVAIATLSGSAGAESQRCEEAEPASYEVAPETDIVASDAQSGQETPGDAGSTHGTTLTLPGCTAAYSTPSEDAGSALVPAPEASPVVPVEHPTTSKRAWTVAELAEAPALVEGDTLEAKARRVFVAWATITGKQPGRTRFTAKRKRAVMDRLREGYGERDLVEACHGVMASPLHQGANDRGTVYDDLELICRHGGKVEEFQRHAEGDATRPQAWKAQANPRRAAEEMELEQWRADMAERERQQQEEDSRRLTSAGSGESERSNRVRVHRPRHAQDPGPDDDLDGRSQRVPTWPPDGGGPPDGPDAREGEAPGFDASGALQAMRPRLQRTRGPRGAVG